MWWHYFLPSATIWASGQISLRWYGLILVLAMIVAGWWARRLLKSKQILVDQQIEDLFFYLIIFSIIGARLGHVLYTWSYYRDHWSDVIKVWHGGISIQGAILAGVLTLLWWSKKHQQSFFRLSDLIVPALALGQAVGRWGNYFNQELYGHPTSGWWGIPIAPLNRLAGYENFVYYQPTFFYESILDLLLFVFLSRLVMAEKYPAGFVTWVYLAGYGVIRFILEFFRIDDTLLINGLRMPQLLSAALFLVAFLVIFFKYLKPLPSVRK